MKAILKPKECAIIADVSLRTIQRAIAAHDLCVVVHEGKTRIRREDFVAWMQKRAQVSPEPCREQSSPHTAPEPPVTPNVTRAEPEQPSTPDVERPDQPFRPANPGGPLTNVPHPASGNWISPEQAERLRAEGMRKLYESLGVVSHEGKKPSRTFAVFTRRML